MSDKIKPGDEWPYHYRGTKYHYSSEQEIWWQTPAAPKDKAHLRGPVEAHLRAIVKSGHENIIKELLSFKPTGGSFKITETGDIIMNIEEGDSWKTIFICEMYEPFEFDDININPIGIQPGDLWPGFYDGARYSYLLNGVWWKNPEGFRQYIKEALPSDVMLQLRMYKPTGGSFRITENGYVITLIQKQPLPNDLKKHWERLSTIQQQLITAKVKRTEMLPVYIGRYHEGMTLKPPVDYSKPLNDEERKDMLDFLDNFSFSKKFEGMVSKDVSKEKLGEDEKLFDDPEDWL